MALQRFELLLLPFFDTRNISLIELHQKAVPECQNCFLLVLYIYDSSILTGMRTENILYEIGSVAGKDMNITLQKHLKHLKTRKYKSYTNFKFAYFSISLFVIIATILIIIFGIRICNKSKKYFDTIYYTHNLNICLLDLGKYTDDIATNFNKDLMIALTELLYYDVLKE